MTSKIKNNKEWIEKEKHGKHVSRIVSEFEKPDRNTITFLLTAVIRKLKFKPKSFNRSVSVHTLS